jgi:fumarate reductase flavoprotein subunit
LDSQFDLVVVGAGVAGLTAARRAQQLGARVALIERSTNAVGAGNMVLSAGWFHAVYRSPLTDPEELVDAITAATDGQTRPDLARAWATTVGRAFRFLSEEGANFSPLRRFETAETFVLEPVTYGTRVGRPWQGSGPHRLSDRLTARFRANGGTLLRSTQAADLILHDGRVGGVVVAALGGQRRDLGAREVLLADGGFQANPDLVARYITSAYRLRGGSGDRGDGLVMGLSVGGVAVQMRGFYGHCLFGDSTRDDRLWPEPEPSALLSAGVVVGPDGHRFADEALGNHLLAAAIAAHPHPADCWLVFDEQAWQTDGRKGLLPANPTLPELQATVVHADGLSDLALACRLPPDALRRSVEVLAGCAEGVPRSGTVRPLSPPYHAVSLIAGITFTLGGLLVDSQAQVLDHDEQPIPGLLAAGGTMGGLNGGPRSGYAGGWSEAASFGLLAAETAAGRRA